MKIGIIDFHQFNELSRQQTARLLYVRKPPLLVWVVMH